jgi:chitodextrinase
LPDKDISKAEEYYPDFQGGAIMVKVLNPIMKIVKVIKKLQSIDCNNSLNVRSPIENFLALKRMSLRLLLSFIIVFLIIPTICFAQTTDTIEVKFNPQYPPSLSPQDTIIVKFNPEYQPPAKITNLLVSNITASIVTLTWTAPGNDGSVGNITNGKYWIKYSTTAPGTDTNAWWEGTITGTTWIMSTTPGKNETIDSTNLEKGKTYWFAIKTADDVGNWSEISNFVSGTIPDVQPPAAINNLAIVTKGATSMNLSWTAPGDDGSTGNITNGEYWIKYSQTDPDGNVSGWWTATTTEKRWTMSTTPSKAETTKIEGIESGKTYYFVIKTNDSNGNWSDLSNVTNGTTLVVQDTITVKFTPEYQPPAVITNLNATADNQTSVTLTWTAPGDNGTVGNIINGKYQIKYGIQNPPTDSQVEWTKNITANTSESKQIQNLTAGTIYYFRIRTSDTNGNWSDWSSVISVATPFYEQSSSDNIVKVSAEIPVGVTLVPTQSPDISVALQTAIAENLNLISPIYDITPEGTVFTKPAQLTFTYNPALVTDLSTLAIYKWTGSTWTKALITNQVIHSSETPPYITGEIQSLSLYAIFAINHAPVLDEIENKNINEGELLQFTINATDLEGDSLTYSATNLPTNASFNPATREFSWIPSYDQAGTYNVQFKVTDGDLFDSKDVTMIVAQGIPVSIKLISSAGLGLAGGVVTYATGSTWQNIGITGSDGTVSIALPDTVDSLTVQMTYNGMSQDLTQNIWNNATFVFQTQDVVVTFKNSKNAGIPGGVVTYVDSTWLNFGTTDANGIARKELLPGSYKFRITYAEASKDKTQDVGANSNVVFQTKKVVVTFKDSKGAGIPKGIVTYASSTWLSFGTTDANGKARKELLPGSYKFRMKYAGASKEKIQNVGSNSEVMFQTKNIIVTLKDSTGKGISGGVVSYGINSWLSFGTTDINGNARKELLAGSYNFRMTYADASKEQIQDISTNPTVVFQTQRVVVTLKNSNGTGIAGGKVTYAGSNTWLIFGTTNNNGIVRKELLPGSYNFRMTYTGKSKDKTQDTGVNRVIAFQF